MLFAWCSRSVKTSPRCCAVSAACALVLVCVQASHILDHQPDERDVVLQLGLPQPTRLGRVRRFRRMTVANAMVPRRCVRASTSPRQTLRSSAQPLQKKKRRECPSNPSVPRHPAKQIHPKKKLTESKRSPQPTPQPATPHPRFPRPGRRSSRPAARTDAPTPPPSSSSVRIPSPHPPHLPTGPADGRSGTPATRRRAARGR